MYIISKQNKQVIQCIIQLKTKVIIICHTIKNLVHTHSYIRMQFSDSSQDLMMVEVRVVSTTMCCVVISNIYLYCGMVQHLLPSWVEWLPFLEEALLCQVDHLFGCRLHATCFLKPQGCFVSLYLTLINQKEIQIMIMFSKVDLLFSCCLHTTRDIKLRYI